jgi:hypothetical protein
MEDQAQFATGMGVDGMAQQDSQQSPPELTINDLANLRAIIDAAMRRGAFAASEATAVGATFDKLNAFLNAVAPPKTEEQSAPTA